MILDRLYPVAIFQDRYHGTYSGALWFAVCNADENNVLDMEKEDDGPLGDDVAAMWFWDEQPDWIAKGQTPQEALEKLLEQTGKPAKGEGHGGN